MKDLLEENLQCFIKALLPQPDKVLQDMRIYAEKHHISIVEPEVGNLLNLLVGLTKAENILEIGTAIGHSTIYMARAMSKGRITTIELMPERADLAAQYFKQAHVDAKIHQIIGDAREIFPHLEETYDLIFLDAAKGQYENFLVYSYDLLKPNGLIVADNILLNGWVVDLNYPKHRQKTFVYRMRDFLESFKVRKDYQCSIIPLGDGVALFRKKERNDEETGIVSACR